MTEWDEVFKIVGIDELKTDIRKLYADLNNDNRKSTY